MTAYLPTTLYTRKQHSDFIEFKKHFRYSDEELQSKMPKKLRAILSHWKENLAEFIAACIEERNNDFEDLWFYELSPEHMDMIQIEEARRQTRDIMKMLQDQNEEYKQQNEELQQQQKNSEKKMRNFMKHASWVVSGGIPEPVPLTRQTAIHVNCEDFTQNQEELFNPPIYESVPLTRQTHAAKLTTANLTRQHANEDDDVPQYYWHCENSYF